MAEDQSEVPPTRAEGPAETLLQREASSGSYWVKQVKLLAFLPLVVRHRLPCGLHNAFAMWHVDLT